MFLLNNFVMLPSTRDRPESRLKIEKNILKNIPLSKRTLASSPPQTNFKGFKVLVTSLLDKVTKELHKNYILKIKKIFSHQ